jgi:hypothetical protein
MHRRRAEQRRMSDRQVADAGLPRQLSFHRRGFREALRRLRGGRSGNRGWKRFGSIQPMTSTVKPKGKES